MLTSEEVITFVRAANCKAGNKAKGQSKTSSQNKRKNTEKATGTAHLHSEGKRKKAKTEDQTKCTLCHHRIAILQCWPIKINSVPYLGNILTTV